MNKIFISLSRDNSERTVNFNKQEVEFEELPNITCRTHYSNISFKDGYRKGDNFQGVSVLTLDIDDNFSIEEMKKKLDGYKALIVTTKSHQAKEKGGKEIEPCDRYRLFLPLEVPITDGNQYKTIVTALIEEFQADKMCKDLGRFYYCNPKQEVHHLSGDRYWDLTQYERIEKAKIPQVRKITKETLVRDDDGKELILSEWYDQLSDKRVMVHCPISPESHKNNDANPSCSMSKNGAYLNLKCFGCGRNDSLYFPSKKKRKKGGVEYIYGIPDFDKESAKQELARGLSTMSEIASELVRLLPVLEKVEMKDD